MQGAHRYFFLKVLRADRLLSSVALHNFQFVQINVPVLRASHAWSTINKGGKRVVNINQEWLDVSGERYVSPVSPVWDRPRLFYGCGTHVRTETVGEQFVRRCTIHVLSPSKGLRLPRLSRIDVPPHRGPYYCNVTYSHL